MVRTEHDEAEVVPAPGAVEPAVLLVDRKELDGWMDRWVGDQMGGWVRVG